MSLILQGARMGIFTAIGMGVGRLISPVVNVVGSTIESTSTAVVAGNGMIIRKAERAALQSKITHEVQLMDMKTQMRTALCEYGEITSSLVERYDKLDSEVKEEIIEWKNRFPVI